MKIMFNKTRLLNILQNLLKISPTRTTLPILNSVIFESLEEGLFVRATDLELSMKIYISKEIEEKGSFLIPLRKLIEILNELPEGKLQLVQNKNKTIELISEKGNYSLMGRPVDEYPSWTNIKEEKTFNINKEKIENIIKKTTHAASKDDIKPALRGVLFEKEENFFNIVSTDGAKLVKITYNEKEEIELKNIIIPLKFLLTIRSFIKKEGIIFNFSKNHLSIKTNEIEITTRLINQQYPNYKSVIPIDNDKKIIVDKKELLASIKRVSIFSNRTTNQINVMFEKNNIKVFTKDPENLTEAEEKVECSYTNDPQTFSFNANYLRETINVFEEGNIEVLIKNNASATIFRPEIKEKDVEIISLLMPIRSGDNY